MKPLELDFNIKTTISLDGNDFSFNKKHTLINMHITNPIVHFPEEVAVIVKTGYNGFATAPIKPQKLIFPKNLKYLSMSFSYLEEVDEIIFDKDSSVKLADKNFMHFKNLKQVFLPKKFNIASSCFNDVNTDCIFYYPDTRDNFEEQEGHKVLEKFHNVITNDELSLDNLLSMGKSLSDINNILKSDEVER